mmetsp:Transcript_394/g.819  ORF Transcript_394/g.819 Transcript_394/m.819 type:complete len:204 (+) Transcript_394:57-668(+)|eukprot:CAMPEP_0115512934 /NCGR_PEP_ID=MMETSP0271-20121206/74793_1 /TAXON_ID=71861 /ORGANISM="Scrippsiella trochoidea, Strain CCMP3099" /LENGTH=203 /DNA_ID=CAMNT_0002943163 /DNA_START=57 /DNA_END=668 /DNA_ORIENTATION=+
MIRTWQCKCGQVQFKLRGEPVIVMNCHCHSCVSVARHCDDKAAGSNISALSEGGGCAKAMFYLENVSLPDDKLAEKLAFCKVGDQGDIIRSYTKCCGTLVNTAGGRSFPTGFRPFNRNCIRNEDGTPYEPKEPVINILAKYAFRPEDVPAPRRSLVPMGILRKFAGGAISYKLGCCPGVGTLGQEKAFHMAGADVSEVVPITW